MTTPTSLQPLFKRVAQQDRHDDLLAVIATLSSRPLDTVYQQAETLGMPKIGPFYPWLDETLLGKLLAANNLKGSAWKPCTSYTELPEIAIVMTDYHTDWEVGRCVLYHRNTGQDGKSAQPYVIDPYPHADPKLYLRSGVGEIAKLRPAWYVGVTELYRDAKG